MAENNFIFFKYETCLRIKLHNSNTSEQCNAYFRNLCEKLNNAERTKIKKLRISQGDYKFNGCKLSEIPPLFANQFKHLIALNLFNKNLTLIPLSIGIYMINLKYLDLNSNKLESLPESIGNLLNLRTLCLCNNKLKSLPESIGNLLNLRTLYLSYNELKSLPKSIIRLTNLESLDLTVNPCFDLRIIKNVCLVRNQLRNILRDNI